MIYQAGFRKFHLLIICPNSGTFFRFRNLDFPEFRKHEEFFFLPRNPLPDMTKMCLGKNPASLSVILKPSGPDLLRHVTYILKTHWSF